MTHPTPFLHFPKINQIGILVKDIATSAAQYASLLGIKPWFRPKVVRHEVIYQDKPITLDLDIAVAFRGGMEYELIQVRGGVDCVYSDLINLQGGGVHHLGAIVRDFDKHLAKIRQLGISVIQSGVITTKGKAVTRYGYLDTREPCGVITELIETRLFGIHAPQNPAMMLLGVATGDVEMLKIPPLKAQDGVI